MPELSITRLYLLRFCYALLFVGAGLTYWPMLVRDAASQPVLASACSAMLVAISVVAFFGLFSPVRLIPILMFEAVWKVLWMAFVALPRWRSGTLDEEFVAALFACSFVVPYLLFIPWRRVVATYLTQPERWGRRAAVGGVA